MGFTVKNLLILEINILAKGEIYTQSFCKFVFFIDQNICKTKKLEENVKIFLKFENVIQEILQIFTIAFNQFCR